MRPKQQAGIVVFLYWGVEGRETAGAKSYHANKSAFYHKFGMHCKLAKAISSILI